VRIIGVPELKGMSGRGLRDSRAAFQHIHQTYRRIRGFDQYGFAEIFFRVRNGPLAGWHGVTIEPFLLRRKGTKGKKINRSSQRTRSR
jgi:hypothetical protein